MFRSSLKYDLPKTPSRNDISNNQSQCNNTKAFVNSKFLIDKYTVGFRSDMSCPIAGNPTYLSYQKIQPKIDNMSIPYRNLKKQISGGSLPSEYLNNWYNNSYPNNPLK